MEISKCELDEAIEKAVEKVLEKLGLSDAYAGEDIRNLRDLLKAFKSAKRTFWQTIVKVCTAAFLMALIAAVAVKLKLLGH